MRVHLYTRVGRYVFLMNPRGLQAGPFSLEQYLNVINFTLKDYSAVYLSSIRVEFSQSLELFSL